MTFDNLTQAFSKKLGDKAQKKKFIAMGLDQNLSTHALKLQLRDARTKDTSGATYKTISKRSQTGKAVTNSGATTR